MGEPTKVYVLTAGSYSDYYIIGIFSDRAAAEDAKREYDSSDAPLRDYNRANEVDEYVLDELAGAKLARYKASIMLDSGNIETETIDYGSWLVPPGGECHVPQPDSRDLRIIVWSSESIEYAAKVAAEKRQEWLRTQPARQTANA